MKYNNECNNMNINNINISINKVIDMIIDNENKKTQTKN